MVYKHLQQTGAEWPKPEEYSKSVRREFSLFVSTLILLLMSITGYIITDRYVKTVTENVLDKHLTQARAYSRSAAKPMLSPDGADDLLLNDICKKLSSDNVDVYWAGVVDRNNVYIAHTDFNMVVTGATLRSPNGSVLERTLRAGEKIIQNADTIFLTIPILENEHLLGYLTVAASTKQVTDAKWTAIILISVITTLMILLSVPITLTLVRRKFKPLTSIIDALKAVDAENPCIDVKYNSRDEFGYLSDSLRVMGDRLAIAQRNMVERERIQREFAIARDIQINMLPAEYPSGPNYRFAGYYSSAKTVGGDYYDFIRIDDRRIGFLVADVSGKSLPGMLTTLLTREIIRRVALHSITPRRLLCEVNRELRTQIQSGMFVTMFYGVIDLTSGEFTFASAGHNPLFWIQSQSGNVKEIKTKGYPLGMMDPDAFDARLEERSIFLEEKDWLIQYTDGINEAQNSEMEEYGMERLIDVARRHRNSSIETFVESFLQEHQKFVGDVEQYDDITLLAMSWKGSTIAEAAKQGATLHSAIS